MVNSLPLNLNKTYYMQFKGTSEPLTNVTAILFDIHITAISEIKFLGVHIQGVPGGMCNTSGECSLC